MEETRPGLPGTDEPLITEVEQGEDRPADGGIAGASRRAGPPLRARGLRGSNEGAGDDARPVHGAGATDTDIAATAGGASRLELAVVRGGVRRLRAHGGVLILGGGFGGAHVAHNLGEQAATIVNPDYSMTFSPLLPEAAGGTLELRHIEVPLRTLSADLVLGRAVGHDPEAREVTVESDAGERLSILYDDLVVAVGAVPRTFPIPGLLEHAVGAKTIMDAIYLRDRVLRQLENASVEPDAERRLGQLTWVFVGGGYAGVETLAELSDFAQDALRYYPDLRGAPQRWVLVDAAPKILSEIPSRLGEYAARELAAMGVDIRTATTLESVDADHVLLSDGTRLACETVVWTAGVAANPVVRRLNLPLDEKGRVKVDEHLRVRGQRNIWALGDCAAVPNPAATGGHDPPTSQHAVRQARVLTHNVAAARRGQALRRYRYRSRGQVATMGRFKGIAAVGPIELSGALGWWMARTVHLLQIPQPARQVRVVADWTFQLLFRRDIAGIGTKPPRPQLMCDQSEEQLQARHELAARAS